MNRRGFIGAMGGLVAVSALPGCRTAPPSKESLFAQRGKFERLVISSAHVRAGATSPFSVLHISDTHLTAVYPHECADKRKLSQIRTKTFGGMQEDALRDSLDWAKRNVDFVVHTGDLIDFQSEANYDLVRKYFGDISMGAMGNHEYSPTMWLTPEKETHDDAWRAKSTDALSKVFPFDLSFASKVINGVNFVTLDDSYATVSASQVERFALEVKKGLPIVLCMHVPFFTEDIWLIKERYWRNHDAKFRNGTPPAPRGDLKRQQDDKITRDFIAYLKSEKLLKAILTGHEHIVMQDRFSPTAIEYAAAANFAFHGQEILFT